MLPNRTNDAEPSVTRRSILKTGLAISAVGASGGATGIVQGGDTNETDATGDESETHTLTVALIDSSDAGVVSGEVTVGEQTKTTTPLNGDPARIQAEFELENGTYTASGTSEIDDETWRTKEKEVTIDGEDAYLSLVLYPPGSDELDGDESEETDDDDSETYTLTTSLVESEDAGVVSGEVTVDGQTKSTKLDSGDSVIIEAEFELENGTYTASGTSEINDETWRTKEKEVTIDGEDAYLSLVLYPPGSDELEDDNADTHTLTVHLVEAEDADIVSGEVTVDGQTKPTTGDDPHYSSAEFELEDGTYTVSGTSDLFPDWRTNEREVTIDGEDASLELYLYPPGSDELEETEPGDDESQDDSDTDENDSDDSEDTDDTSEETDTEDDGEKSAPSDESGDTDSTDQNQDADNCP